MLYEDCYTFQLTFHLMAAKLSNDVLNVVSFRHCLQVDFSWNFIILKCFDHLLWPLGLQSNMALIEVLIDI
jgi:hypothetical protein